MLNPAQIVLTLAVWTVLVLMETSPVIVVGSLGSKTLRVLLARHLQVLPVSNQRKVMTLQNSVRGSCKCGTVRSGRSGFLTLTILLFLLIALLIQAIMTWRWGATGSSERRMGGVGRSRRQLFPTPCATVRLIEPLWRW